MIVTSKNIALEKKLIEFLDRIALRISQPNPKLDYPLLIDGYEGYGKTNIGAAIGCYIAEKTGREFGLDQIFFDAEQMIKYAISHENKIIMWDEAALAALAMQQTDKIQVALIKMLMVARKKRHLFIINIPRFYRLKEPVIERCMGLIHVYARNQTIIGRFFFYKKAGLEALYEEYRRTRRKPNYNQWTSVRGSFGQALYKVVDEAAYEKKKDQAILTILNSNKKTKGSVHKTELYRIKKKLAVIEYPIKSRKDLADKLGLAPSTISGWVELQEDEPLEAPVPEKSDKPATDIYNKGLKDLIESSILSE